MNDNWRDEALCLEIGGDPFFPEKGEPIADVKRVCQGCPVRAECLEYSIVTNQRYGVWGGVSERNRRKLIAKRREAVA